MENSQNPLDLLLHIIDENWSSLVVCFADLWNAPWTLFPDERDGYEVSYLEKGSGVLYIQDRSYHMKAGDFILVHSADGNRFISDGGDFWILQSTFAFNSISDTRQLELLHQQISAEAFPWQIGINSGLTVLMHQMNRVISVDSEHKQLRLKMLLLNVILTVKSLHHEVITSPNGRKYDQNIRLMIDNVEMYIIRNFSKKITISELAKIALVTPQYLCSRFKHVTGKSIVGYINDYRIKRSKKLLLYSNLSITSIANDVGFCNSQYFNRVFMHSENMTPSQFRKTMQDVY